MQTVYKIILANGKTLFKGLEGSRTLPFNKWLKAEKKMVRDKYPSGKQYLSGFHVFLDYETAKEYLLKQFRTKKERIIIQCVAKGVRKKPTKGVVWLADELYILGEIK